MAIRVVAKQNLKMVEVISSKDDALDMEKSNYDEYVKTGDVSKLVFVEGKQPTRFICNFELSGREASYVKNEIMGGKDEDGKPKLSYGSWQHRVAKFTLKDIQNPADVPREEQMELKKDDRGYVNDYTMGILERYGIVDDIFVLYTHLVLEGAKQNAKN